MYDDNTRLRIAATAALLWITAGYVAAQIPGCPPESYMDDQGRDLPCTAILCSRDMQHAWEKRNCKTFCPGSYACLFEPISTTSNPPPVTTSSHENITISYTTTSSQTISRDVKTGLIGGVCAFVFLSLIGSLVICWLNRPKSCAEPSGHPRTARTRLGRFFGNLWRRKPAVHKPVPEVGDPPNQNEPNEERHGLVQQPSQDDDSGTSRIVPSGRELSSMGQSNV